MRMQSNAVLKGIKSSKGQNEGFSSDSTTFFLEVDMADSSWGESWGCVTSPFKFGDASEQAKWAAFKDRLNKGEGINCDCAFDVLAGSDGKPRLTLLAIKPISAPVPAKAV